MPPLGGECIEVACNVVGAIYNHDGRPGCIGLTVLGGSVSFLEKPYHPFNVGLMFVGGAEVHFNLVVFQLFTHTFKLVVASDFNNNELSIVIVGEGYINGRHQGLLGSVLEVVCCEVLDIE